MRVQGVSCAPMSAVAVCSSFMHGLGDEVHCRLYFLLVWSHGFRRSFFSLHHHDVWDVHASQGHQREMCSARTL